MYILSESLSLSLYIYITLSFSLFLSLSLLKVTTSTNHYGHLPISPLCHLYYRPIYGVFITFCSEAIPKYAALYFSGTDYRLRVTYLRL
jgi:hypothetical protein